MSQPRSRRLLTAAAAIGGLALFAWSVNRVGIPEIVDGIGRVGWGLLPILGLGGLRFAVRAECWRLCMPPETRLSFGQAFAAFLASDAVGNVTPLGPIASEPAKVLFTRDRLATRESVSSLALDNLIYAASVGVVVAAGAVVMLLTVPLPFQWREATVAVLIAVAAASAVGMRLLRGTWTEEQGQRPPWRERLAAMRQRILEFSSGHPMRIGRVFALDLVFHLLAFVEAFLTLRWLLGDMSPSLAQAFVFSVMDRVVTVAFKFVPLRVGVDEAFTGALAPVLEVQSVVGVTLAVVRKVRNLFWAGVGLLLIAARRAQAAPATDHRGSVRAHRT